MRRSGCPNPTLTLTLTLTLTPTLTSSGCPRARRRSHAKLTRPRGLRRVLQNTHTSLPRAVRTGGAGWLAPRPHALHVLGSRPSLGRTVRTLAAAAPPACLHPRWHALSAARSTRSPRARTEGRCIPPFRPMSISLSVNRITRSAYCEGGIQRTELLLRAAQGRSASTAPPVQKSIPKGRSLRRAIEAHACTCILANEISGAHRWNSRAPEWE